MKFVPFFELTDRQIYDAYLTTFNPDLSFHMGVDPSLIVNPPTLPDFYRNFKQAHDNGIFQGWGIISKDGYEGHTILNKLAFSEWEISTVLRNPERWSSGTGARATLHALRWAFEEDAAPWVIAFAQGKDERVRDMLQRGGFKPFSNMLVMDRSTWNERWGKEE